jgi:alkanesulfonate monooxygenase
MLGWIGSYGDVGLHSDYQISFGAHVPMLNESFQNPTALIDFAKTAEKLGFDSLWAVDQMIREKGATSDPLVTLAIAGANTSTIRLGTAILICPPYHPIVLARTLASLDNMLGCRLIVGVGMGHYKKEMEALGINWLDRYQRGEEVITALRSLLTGEKVDFNGKFFSFRDIQIFPRLQWKIPIWIGAQRPSAFRRPALLGDGWISSGYWGSVQAVSFAIKEITRIAREAGRNPDSITLASNLNFCVARDEADAIDRSKDHFLLRYGSADRSRMADIGVFGNVHECIEKLRSRREAGIRYFNLNFTTDEMAQLELVSKEVIPSLKRR